MKRSNFNLGYTHLTSCDMGELVPIGLKEIYQGDIIDMSTSVLTRLSPLVAPVMHPTHICIHHWFVPHRLVWDNSGGADTGFEAFLTAGPSGTSAPTHPTITLPNSGAGGVVAGSLADYLGIPLGYNADNTGYTVSALPFRGYALIWNNFYRDEDLQTLLVIDKTDGADTTTSTVLQNVCWEKDYFTSSRPFAQKGAAVSLPLGTTAPIVQKGTEVVKVYDAVNATTTAASPVLTNTSTGLTIAGIGVNNNVGVTWRQAAGEVVSGMQVDLTTATAASISSLRLASAVQTLLENGARHGSRMIEYLRRMGIRSSDARLQLPEYLGGGRDTIQISEVLQTAEGASDPVGALKGHGISATSSNKFIRFFEEPGYLFSFAYVKPKTIYTQGLERHWNRRTRLEYWQPELQFIGQQSVLNKEIYAPHTTPDGTFGYQDRYDELRRSESRVSGEFRTSTLNFWHFGRSFGSSPTLNGAFVSAVPTDIPFAVPSEDVLYLMVRHSIRAKRLLARDATPRLK